MPKPAILLLLLLAVPAARAQLIVSEVMADPSALADAQGEFVELANAGDRPDGADSVRLVLDGDTLALGALGLAPGAHRLLCRDSAALAAAGVACHRGLPRLSLANSRPLKMAVLWKDRISSFDIPAAKAGVAWENTWDDDMGLLAFARSAKAFLSGDSATPGERNSRSVRRARRNLGLAGARIEGSSLHVTVADRGTERASGGLSLRLDRDWDGRAETFLDSLPVPAGGGEIRFPLGPDDDGILEARLPEDEDPADDVLRRPRPGGPTLVISELCPDPETGPEWVEIRNATGEGGGAARPLDLARVEWEGAALGAPAGKLLPGEYLLLAEDAEALRALLGPLKARILRPPSWGSLRNTGDTLRIRLEGATLDSLAYGSRDAAASPCLSRGGPSGDGLSGFAPARPQPQATPGYPSAEPPYRADLRLTRRILSRGEAMEIAVEVPPGGGFGLRVFDLEGNCRRILARGGPGRHAITWGGEGERGHRLPPGPYILALAAGVGKPRRVAVVLAGAP